MHDALINLRENSPNPIPHSHTCHIWIECFGAVMALSIFPVFGMGTRDPIFINQPSLRMWDAPGKKLTP